jgi:hypothetical protein
MIAKRRWFSLGRTSISYRASFNDAGAQHHPKAVQPRESAIVSPPQPTPPVRVLLIT